MTPESCNLLICWAALRWARSRGNAEGAAARQWIVGTRFHGNEPPKHSNSENAITLLLKEVISIRFDQNLPQGENWPTEDAVGSQKWIFSLCALIIVHNYEVLELQ
jgi:hypothetical protein